MEPILRYGNVQLLNAPFAKSVADEVLKDDCYRLSRIIPGSAVVDIGAFYGEFAIACAKLGHSVFAYEPSRNNWEVFQANLRMNDCSVNCFQSPVTGNGEKVDFILRSDHPAGSMSKECPGSSLIEGEHLLLDSLSIHDVLKQVSGCCLGSPIFIKMDCEGGEISIFGGDLSWLDQVHQISMEWHNHDGDTYRKILEERGFKVELEGGGPIPRPVWNESIGGGLLHAERSKQ